MGQFRAGYVQEVCCSLWRWLGAIHGRGRASRKNSLICRQQDLRDCGLLIGAYIDSFEVRAFLKVNS